MIYNPLPAIVSFARTGGQAGLGHMISGDPTGRGHKAAIAFTY